MKKLSKKKLKIVSIIPKKYKETWQKLTNEWDQFFNIEHVIDDFANFDNFLNMHIDFLFIEVNYFEKTLLSTIENFKSINKSFSIIIIKDAFSHRDAELLKNLADDVINLENGLRYLKWKTLSLLRRYWHTFSKPTTIFHKGLIIDLNNFYVSKNRKIVRLTHK
ncbi:MAG: hypothetical protein E7Y34_01910, partial [Mycoplasma sp.]|nr:hypothetical protein [Mycoplasma sp.]